MRKPLRALIVEDSDAGAELLVNELRREEYDLVSERVQTAGEMTAALERAPWDIVMASGSTASAAGFSPVAALHVLKDGGHDLPFILVSGTIGQDAAVTAIRSSNDFLIKGREAQLAPAIERELRVAQHCQEQRRAEEALRRSEAQYRSLVEHAAFGIYRATVDGCFLTVNPALVAMLGYGSADELLSVHLPSLYATADVDGHERGAAGTTLDGGETIWKRKSGELIRVRLNGHLTEQGHTGRPQFEVIVQDVTEEFELQQQLRVTQKMEALGRLAGGVAHDFNNVLTAILGYTEILSDQIGPDKPIGADLRQIKAAADRAAALTKQLLAFSRKQVLAVTPVDLSAVVRSLDTMVGRLLGAPVTIKTDLSDRLPKVMADAAQLEHLLISLAVNARDAMPQGGVITISTSAIEIDSANALVQQDLKAGSYAALSVADEGIGMSREVQERIFDPFFTTKERGHGTGLGLAAVYGAVKQLGGHISVASQPGRGSTFTIYLPATEREPAVREGSRVTPPAGQQTVMVVDDEPGVRALAKTVLERAGYRVIEAGSGEAALRWFDEHDEPVHLLLTDVVLPGLNGHELAVRIARRQPNIRRLFTSGYSAQLGPFARLFGPDAQILEKPFTGRILLAKARQVLAAGAAPAA
jgi:PAS domain S-box-containing protein